MAKQQQTNGRKIWWVPIVSLLILMAVQGAGTIKYVTVTIEKNRTAVVRNEKRIDGLQKDTAKTSERLARIEENIKAQGRRLDEVRTDVKTLLGRLR